MARNVYPWKYLCYRHCANAPKLSLWDLQQVGNVHAVKDTVPNRRGTFENPTKGQPKLLRGAYARGNGGGRQEAEGETGGEALGQMGGRDEIEGQ